MSAQQPETKHKIKLILFSIPLLVVLVLVAVRGAPNRPSAAKLPAHLYPKPAEFQNGRLVIVIVDSLRRKTMNAVMPELLKFSRRKDTTTISLHTCSANFSVPCMLTMFEGRQSPFNTGLYNWSKQQGSSASLPAILKRAGIAPVLLSNHALLGLYGSYATKKVNIEDWKDEPIARDMKTIDKAIDFLKDPTNRVLVLHILGTDHAAHYDQWGTVGYNEHFRAVDKKLVEFRRYVDPKRDQLVILGDHGHRDDGHHTRDSVAVFQGRRFDEFFGAFNGLKKLEQTELIYLFSYVYMIPLPLQYEGRYFVKAGMPARLKRFVDLQHKVVTASGIKAPTPSAAFEKLRTSQSVNRFDRLFTWSPVLLGLLAYLLLLFSAIHPTRQEIWALLGLAAGTIATGLISGPAAGLWLAMPWIGLLAWICWWKKSWRKLAFMAILLAFAGFTGAVANDWSGFFHKLGGRFNYPILIFYPMVPLIGWLLARLLYRENIALPEGALALCIIGLPSGVYYYEFGPNVLQGFLIGAVLTAGLFWGVMRERALKSTQKIYLHGSIVLLSGVLLVLQEGSNWQWRLFSVRWLSQLGLVASLLVFVAISAYLLSLLRNNLQRVGVALFLLAEILYCVWFAGLDLATFVCAHIPVVLVISWLHSPWSLRGLTDSREQRIGLLMFAAALAIHWIIYRGFFIKNIDIKFVFHHFGQLRTERDLALVGFVFTALKYGLPTVLLLTLVRLVEGARIFRQLFGLFLLFAGIKVLALFLQVFLGMLGGIDKRYEFSISDLVFLFQLLLISGLTMLAIMGLEFVGNLRRPAVATAVGTAQQLAADG